MLERRLPQVVALAAALSAAVTLGAAAPVAAARPGTPPASGGCQVRTLALPDGAVEGRVMDVERVRGRGVVYYGTYWVVDEEGVERQRAVLWYGLDGEPVPVGPGGAVEDIAYELTSTGLINGESLDAATQTWRPWVQNIRSGKLTYVHPGPAGSAPLSVFVRRINDKGALAGSGTYADGITRVLTWKRAHKDPRALTGDEWVFAEALGINNDRDLVGAVWSQAEGEEFFVPRPRLWSLDGSMTELATFALGVAYPRVIDDAGQAAGNVDVGEEFAIAHREAAFWPVPEEVIGLGLLPGGGRSDVFGLDDGWVVGFADVYDPENPDADEFGSTWHSFLWTGEDPGSVRVLPSPYAQQQGSTDWREWYGGAAHAVNKELNQVGTSSDANFLPDGTTMRLVPTVYLNADTCGQLVPTTHTPFWLDESGPFAQPAPSATGSRTASSPHAAHRPDSYPQRSPGKRDTP